MHFLCLVPQKVRIQMIMRAWGRYVNLPALKIKMVESFPAIAYKIKWTAPPPPPRLLVTEMFSERSVLESQDRRSAPRAIVVSEQVQATCHQGLGVFYYQTRRQGCLISASGACGFAAFECILTGRQRHIFETLLTANIPIFKHEHGPDNPLSTCSKGNSQWNDCHNPRRVSSCISWNLHSAWVLNVSIYKKRWVVFQKLWIH